MNNNENQKFCGNCRFNKHDSQDFYCANEQSDNFTDYTTFGDFCEDWEEMYDEYNRYEESRYSCSCGCHVANS